MVYNVVMSVLLVINGAPIKIEDGTCLNPDLKCDGHPQCSDLSDEKNCYDDYIRRGIIRDSATIQCKSKNYPGKNNSRVSVGQIIKILFLVLTPVFLCLPCVPGLTSARRNFTSVKKKTSDVRMSVIQVIIVFLPNTRWKHYKLN